MSVRSLKQIWVSSFKQAVIQLAWFTVLLSLMLSARVSVHAQSSPPSRPILFVHGFCGSAADFQPLLGPLYQQLDHSLYPSSALYYVRYDNAQHILSFFNSSGNSVDEGSIASNVRFFAIEFYDPIDDTTDPSHVAKISVLNKAYEIDQAIKHITAITHVKDVILVAHSMGGLDARAYIENMASPTGCYDYINNTPYYVSPQCAPGSGDGAYAGDVGDLITVDTPHLGSPLAAAPNLPGACFLNSSTNKTELELEPLGGSGLIEALNYNRLAIAEVTPAPYTAPTQAIEDYFTDIGTSWTGVTGESDDIVPQPSQSVVLNIPSTDTTAPLKDVQESYLSTDTGIAETPGCWYPFAGLNFQVLHFMPCLGAQPNTQSAIVDQLYTNEKGTLTSINVNATHNGSAWTGAVDYQISGPDSYWEPETSVPMTVSDVPLGTYSVSHISGGPTSAGTPTVTVSPTPTIQQGQWTTTFTINFTDKSASTTTISASSTQISQGASVTLTARVHVTTGTPTGTVTFYDNGNTLSSVAIDSTGTGTYPTTSLPTGSNSITATYGGDTNFSSSTSPIPTIITVASASMVLPAPTLTSPPNGAGNQLTTPVFIWSQVPNNAGYRIMVADNMAALPTDPNASSCVPADSACVIDEAQSLSTDIYYYATPSGKLLPGTTYYWQVHARAGAPYLPGYWAGASFTTASGNVGNDFSLQVSPSAQTVTPGNAGSFIISTATTSGAAQTVALSVSGLPSGITQSFTPASITSGYQSTLTLNTSASLPSGTYGATVTGTAPSGTHNYPISLTVTQASTATYMVTVQLTGLGIVSSQDGRLNCNNRSCSAVYTKGSSIVLSEVAGSNYSFTGWGEACTGLGACSFTVTNNMLVTAAFTPNPGTVESALTTTVVGSGTISSTDGLVNCSTSCETVYPNNASVILNAIANPGYALSGWTGDCTGQGQCILPLDHNKTVQATFSSVAGNTLMVVSPGTLTTVAGNGTLGYGGDGGPATLAEMNQPFGTAVDASGNVYIADFDGDRIRVVNTQPAAITLAGVTIEPGNIATLTGNGTGKFSGDGGPATSAEIYGPTGITFDSAGNLYFVDSDNNRVRAINLQAVPITIAGITIQPGTIQTVAGSGSYGYTGDGVAATSAGLTTPESVLVDKAGNIYIGEWVRVRIVDSKTGIINTYAGGGLQNCTGLVYGVSRGCLATSTTFGEIAALAMDSLGNLFLADPGWGITKMVYKSGTFPDLPTNPVAGYIYAINGYGTGCTEQSDSAGDGCSISNSPGIVAVGLAVDSGGSLYFANAGDSRVHRVDRTTGLMEAIGGNGTAGYLQDGVSATSTEIAFNGNEYGSVLSMDALGNLYFADATTNRIREINSSGAPLSLLSSSVGAAGSGVTITVENSGAFTMNQPVLSISGTNQGEFSETDTCSSSIQPGASCSITVIFTPSATGTRYAELNISSSNAQNSPQTIELSGNEVGATGTLNLGATSITFTSQTIGSPSAAQSVVITNSGSADLPTPTISVSGSNASEFSSTNSCQAGIAAGANCSVAMTFTPTASGTRTATLVLTDANASNSPQSISLSGTGVAPIQTPVVTVTPSSSSITTTQALTVSVAVAGTSGSQTPTGSVILTSGSYTTAAVALSSGSATISIPPGLMPSGTDALTVSYTPDVGSSSIYNSASGSTSVSVSKTAPSMTVTPLASSITSTQALTVTVAVSGGSGNPTPTGSVTLTGGGYTSTAANLTSGSATINIPAGKLTKGNDTLTATYTPDSSSSATYNSATGISAAVTVTQAVTTPTVTVTPSSSSITTAQPLTVTVAVSGGNGNPTPTGSVTLTGGGYTSAAATLTSGSATINIPAGKLTKGNDTLAATYTPDSTSSATYNSATGISAAVTVTQAVTTPTVTVTPSASSITTAQPLTVTVAVSGGSGNPTPTGSVTLTGGGDTSAAATLTSGSAAISIPAGKLAAGSDTLTATYTPDSASSATYNSATGTSPAVTVTAVVAATPTFSVPAGTYTATQMVAISDATNGATIYYTTNGITPTTSSSVYNGPITVSASETLEAIATASGYSASAVATAAYTITPPAAIPIFSPVAGTYTSGQSVTISDATSGAAIYYTTNGSTPTTSSTLYGGPITVSSTETIEAIATASGYSVSPVATATYTISIPTNPVPVVNNLSPAYTSAGSAAFTLTLNGSGFIATSTVYWGSTALSTQYGSTTQLTAQIPASDIAAAGITAITVQSPTPGGGTSNPVQFEVDSAGSGTPPTFTTVTATVAPGSTATYPVTLPSSATSVSVTCLNLPSGAQCSYSSTTNAVTITTSSTTPAGTYQITVVFTETEPGAAGGFILLPILLLPLVILRRKQAARGLWLTTCMGLVLMAALAFNTGCGGGGGGGGGGSTPPPQTHQVTSSGAVSLIVQ